jgi:hypothetical protein
MSLLTAILTATVFALFGFPFRYYQCWFSFSRVGTLTGTAMYLSLAGGVGGMLGWLGAYLTHAQPTPNLALNGLLYGAGGAVALRAEFRTRSKEDAPIADQMRDARSALAKSVNWTAELLDETTYRKAEAWLLSLPDDRLNGEAWRIQAHIANQPARSVTDKVKTEMFEKLVPAMEKLNNPTENKAGRAHLVTFCAAYYRNEHLPRTPQKARAGDRVGVPFS